MRTFVTLSCVSAFLSFATFGNENATLYQNDFENVDVGKLPDGFLVLDGAFSAFTVQQQGTNKVLELPGAPLDSFGLLFGPSEKDGVSVAARVYGTSKGRRYPVFGVSLNGVGGYKLQVSPAKRALEFVRGETVKTSVPYTWESGKWTHLRLQVRHTSNGYQIEGKAWPDGAQEPATWTISTVDKDEFPAGRAGLLASPFSGTPILFDDLLVTKLSP